VLGVEPRLATSPQTAAALGAVRAAKQRASTSPDGTHGRVLSRRVLLLSGGCAAAVGLGLYLIEGSRGTSPHTSTRTGTTAAVKLPTILDGLPGQANAVAFSPDGTTLAACSGSATVLLWNLTGPRAVVTHTVELPSDESTSMAVSPTARRSPLAAACPPLVPN
jgi:WD40 repeat protein